MTGNGRPDPAATPGPEETNAPLRRLCAAMWAAGTFDDLAWTAMEGTTLGALPATIRPDHLLPAAVTGLLDLVNLDPIDAARRFRAVERHCPSLGGLLICSAHPDLPYPSALGLDLPVVGHVATVIYLRHGAELSWLAARLAGTSGERTILGRPPGDPQAMRARAYADTLRHDPTGRSWP